MSDHQENSSEFKFAAGYAECIAHVANRWATTDYYINDAIWKLSGMPPAIGACLTAQLINLNSRLNALLSLLKLREADKKLIERVNKFADSARGPNEKRNRIIHDMWMIAMHDPGAMGQLTIVAPKKLTFQAETIPLDDLRADLEEIIKCQKGARDIRDAIIAAFPSLPEIPHTKLHPIIEHPEGR